MNIIVKVIQEENIISFATMFLSFSSLLASIVAVFITYSHNKIDEQNKKIEMQCNYHCFPMPLKNHSIEIKTNSKSSLIGYMDEYNVLIGNKKGSVNDLMPTLDFVFKFKNHSKILPSTVLINKLTINYLNKEVFKGVNGLLKSIEFSSIDNQLKKIYIDEDHKIVFKVKCFITENQKKSLIEYLEKDKVIEIDIALVFSTAFNVKTYGEYQIKLELKKVNKCVVENCIGLDSQKFSYEVKMLQYKNNKIEYEV